MVISSFCPLTCNEAMVLSKGWDVEWNYSSTKTGPINRRVLSGYQIYDTKENLFGNLSGWYDAIDVTEYNVIPSSMTDRDLYNSNQLYSFANEMHLRVKAKNIPRITIGDDQIYDKYLHGNANDPLYIIKNNYTVGPFVDCGIIGRVKADNHPKQFSPMPAKLQFNTTYGTFSSVDYNIVRGYSRNCDYGTKYGSSQGTNVFDNRDLVNLHFSLQDLTFPNCRRAELNENGYFGNLNSPEPLRGIQFIVPESKTYSSTLREEKDAVNYFTGSYFTNAKYIDGKTVNPYYIMKNENVDSLFYYRTSIDYYRTIYGIYTDIENSFLCKNCDVVTLNGSIVFVTAAFINDEMIAGYWRKGFQGDPDYPLIENFYNC